MFVLDEADEMLSRGFKDQIYDIFQKLNSNTQVRAALLESLMILEEKFQVPGEPNSGFLS